MAFDGGCACGAVRYRLVTAPMIVHCCHCRDCQRQSGSGFVVNALIETDRIELLQGQLKPTGMPTDSGRVHDVYRCTECGTSMWSDYGGRPRLRFVRVGTMDEPSEASPDVHIFVRTKLPWVRLAADAQAFQVFYNAPDVWTAEAQARRRAISG